MARAQSKERWWCAGQRGNDFFVLTVGPLTLEKELVVAEIVDDGLIGYGLLAGGDCGPADVLLSQNVIYNYLDGTEILCLTRVAKKRPWKVTTKTCL